MENIEKSRQIHEERYGQAVRNLYYLFGSENPRRFLGDIQLAFEEARVRNKALESLEKYFFLGEELDATTSDRKIELDFLRETIGGIQ